MASTKRQVATEPPEFGVETGAVHAFKTAHYEQFERDYKERVVDVALATGAAPTCYGGRRLPVGTPLIKTQ
jgi:hypothetical protein